MAANSPAKATPYGENDQVSYAELNTIHTQAYESVNRKSTVTAWKSIPICYSGTLTASTACHWHGYYFDNTEENGVPPGGWFEVTGLPDGHAISGIRACFYPTESHAGGLPQYQPEVWLYRRMYGAQGGSVSSVSHVACSVASPVAYDIGFNCSTSISPTLSIDKSVYSYFIKVYSEYGTDSKTGLQMNGIQLEVTVDSTEGGPDFLFW